MEGWGQRREGPDTVLTGALWGSLWGGQAVRQGRGSGARRVQMELEPWKMGDQKPVAR